MLEKLETRIENARLNCSIAASRGKSNAITSEFFEILSYHSTYTGLFGILFHSKEFQKLLIFSLYIKQCM